MESAQIGRLGRLFSLDALRGLIMILMAVDHANYFVAQMHPTGEFWGVPLPQYGNMAEFLTRFITHICAPGFFFLMGAGMVLFAHSRRSLGWPEGKISRHLLVRGLILIFLQFFLENPAWTLGPVYTFHPPGGGDVVWLYFGVLSSLGAAMIIGALFLGMKTITLIGLSSIITIGAQFLVPDASQAAHLYSPLLRILYIPGRTGIFQAFYPIIPWLGIVLFGIVFGKWLLKDKASAYRWSLPLGVIFSVAFLVLRISGGLGNIHPPDGPGFIAFLNVTKYPPSMTFTFLTLSLCLIILWIFSRFKFSSVHRGNPFLVFGRSALFFYILHLYFFAVIGLFFASRGGSGLAAMYPIWLVVLIMLYSLCQQYGKFKEKKSADSLWRLF